MTVSDQPVRSFFMKDLYDIGLSVAKKQPYSPTPNSMALLDGYTLMDDAIDANGKPNYDYHIWTGLARLLISAGDLSHVGVLVTAEPGDLPEAGQGWSFAFDFNDAFGERTFLTLYPVTGIGDYSDTHKAMGPIATEAEYMPKLGAYPLMVNPAMGRRATAALNFILAMALRSAGLQVIAHYVPEDTSTGEAIYLLSDGQTHYQMDYHGPILEEALSIIDVHVGRTEEDGAVIMDAPILNSADGIEAVDGEQAEEIEEDELAAPHVDLTDGQLPH